MYNQLYKYAAKKRDEEGMEAVYGLNPSIGALALQGVPLEDQLYAMKDRDELRSAGLKGMGIGGLAGSILGGLTGAAISDVSVDPRIAVYSAGAGALLGGLSGYILKNKSKFKEMADRKGVDDDYSLRHVPFYGTAAQVAALQGLSKDQQVDANIDALKMNIPGAALGMIAHYPSMGTATAGASLVGSEWAYNKLKEDKK